MGTAFALVASVVVALGAGLRLYSWSIRRRGRQRVSPEDVRRIARGVTLRVLVQGATVWPRMSTRRANRTRGDLILTDSRFVVTSSRGVLLDLQLDGGRLLVSARSPGPGRLVLEGDVPRSDGRKGLYRIETMVEDAGHWAESLREFVRPRAAGELAFAVRAPWDD